MPFRWVIGLLLFASTVINYIDRQTLSVLAPHIKTEFHWSNTDFALVIIAFRAAYAIGQTLSGRLLDRIGTRVGLIASVTFYSTVAVATSLVTGFRSMVACRFLLGLGESANWPGATKAVAEWFPRRESGWAVALFDSGSSIGGALAPLIVLGVYKWFGSWRPAFILTGLLGFIWVFVFRALYRSPESHERVSPAELKVILEDRESGIDPARAGERLSYSTLLRLPQTWGIVIGKTLSDPVWFFITDWFAIYLVSRNYQLEDSLMAFWVPFLAADLGNFAGGGLSSWLISRGWSVGAARKLVVVLGGAGMTLLAPTVFVESFAVMVACFAVATFCVRGAVDDDPQPARRRVSHRIGRVGQRPERHRRRHRHDRGHTPDRRDCRSPVVLADPHRREPRAARVCCSRSAAGQKHRSHAPRRAPLYLNEARLKSGRTPTAVCSRAEL